MKVRKFYAKETREAMRLVRESLGPNAIILSNRPKGEGVELLAVPDISDDPLVDTITDKAEKPVKKTKPPVKNMATMSKNSPLLAYSSAHKEDEKRKEQFNKKESNSKNKDLNDLVGKLDDNPYQHIIDIETSGEKAIESLRNEMAALKGLLQEQLSGLVWGNLKHKSPVQASILRQLAQCGFSADVSRRVVQTIDKNMTMDDAIPHIKEVLGHSLISLNSPVEAEKGIYALVGPSGVGKTMAIAKMASQCVKSIPPEKIALISTDTRKIGAADQLRIYGKILGVNVKVVDDLSMLEESLKELSKKHLVFIDTPGMNPNDSKLNDFFSMVQTCDIPVKMMLVIAANAQMSFIRKTFEIFSSLGISAAILTKLDECSTLGEALSNLIEYQIPIAYISNGTQIPDDLSPIKSSALIHKAIAMGRLNNKDMSDDYLARLFSEADIDGFKFE